MTTAGSNEERTGWRPRVRLTSFGYVVLVLLVAGVASAQAATLDWSGPHAVDRTSAGAPQLISCPTASLCVGLSQDGHLYATSDPTNAGSWRDDSALVSDFSHDGDAEDPAYVQGFDCASASLCVELDNGVARVSTALDRGRWSRFTALKAADNIGGLACPSTHLCVAYGDRNDGSRHEIYSATDPTAGASSTWQAGVPSAFSASSALDLTLGTAIVCPSPSLCLFGTGDGEIAYSADPSGGAQSWQLANLAANDSQALSIESLSCATAELCVALASDGGLYTSTDPTAGQWQSATAASAHTPTLQDVACASASFCLAITSAHALVTSTGAGTSGWTPVHSPFPTGTTLTNVSCAESDVCAVTGNRFPGALVAPGFADRLAVARVPGLAAQPAWTHIRLSTMPVALDAIACPSRQLCVGADALGQALTSTRPAGGWRTSVITSTATTGISCPSVSLCVISDDDGNVLSSTAPRSGRWKSTFLNNTDACDSSCGPSDPLDAVACPSTTLCWTDGPDVTYGSDYWSSSNPAADIWHASVAWATETEVDGSVDSLSGQGLACASVRLCIGTGPTQGDGFSGTGVWRPGRDPVLIPGINGTAVACAGTRLCAILAGRRIFVSTRPADPRSWHGSILTSRKVSLTAIACPSAGLCVVGDSAGQIAVTTHPAGGPRAWAFTTVDRGNKITAIACAAARYCVAGDDDGQVIVATS